MTKETVIKNIQFLARKRGIPLGLLERRMGVSKGYLSRVKSKNGLSIDHVLKAAEILKCSIEILFNEDLAVESEITSINEQIRSLCERRQELEGRLHK